MSLGFSLADVKFAFDLGKLIYEKCFTKANRAGRPFLSIYNTPQPFFAFCDTPETVPFC